MWWFVLLLVVAGVVAVAVWDYRRKSAARESASKARFEEIFKRQVATAASSPQAPSAVPAAPPPAPSPPIPAATAVPAVRAENRFLGKTEAKIYSLLKAGMPDHEVFANVMLASVVSATGAGREREQQMRRLSQYQIDFVVCDRDMRVVAAVELDTVGGADAIGMQRFKAECLNAAGIRLIRINAAAPPRSAEIRERVLGSAGA